MKGSKESHAIVPFNILVYASSSVIYVCFMYYSTGKNIQHVCLSCFLYVLYSESSRVTISA
jgi:hypothetical protein